MNCQIGSRRCATWDEIEDAPQLKRIREEKQQESASVQNQSPNNQKTVEQPATTGVNTDNASSDGAPKFYISAPIQGFTVSNNGGCRYLFF